VNSQRRKKLPDMKIFSGQIEEITISDFRAAPGDTISQVQMGKNYDVTRNGHVVAVLREPELSALELGAAIRRLNLAGA